MNTTNTIPAVPNFLMEFLMTRGKFDPSEFGIQGMDREKFMDLMVDEFNARYHGQWTIDEVLLHPREAQAFCDAVRHHYGWLMLPDDIILRSILTRRKNP